MLIGVDFDNTIVCWDELFHAAASEQGLLAQDVPRSKEKIRDYLRECGREEAWIGLQGYVYGVLVRRAPLFPGVSDFFNACRRTGIRVTIISHKTRHPFMGPVYDFHQGAQEYLCSNDFYDPEQMGLKPSDVFFELTKAEKLKRILQVECTHFIDDLPEFLTEPGFPIDVQRVLFDPNGYHADHPQYRRATSWTAIQQWLTGSTSR